MNKIQNLSAFCWDEDLLGDVETKIATLNRIAKRPHVLDTTQDRTHRWKENSQYLQVLEAVASSRIEGINTSVSAVMTHTQNQRTILASNLRDAYYESIETMKTKPITINLLKEAHKTLFLGSGQNPAPGEIRQVMVSIGNHLPPPPNELPEYLTDLERFINGDTNTLVKAAIAHAYFEMIHPFQDGNGRIGRLLIQLIMRELVPGFPMSVVIEANRAPYYKHLDICGNSRDWDKWIHQFLLYSDELATQLLSSYQTGDPDEKHLTA